MAETILGIDLAGQSVRLVQLGRQFLRLTPLGWAQADLPSGADLPTTAAAVRRLVESRGLLSDVYVLGLPTDQAMFRRLDFPFSSLGKIRQVLALEMDACLPLPVEDLALDMLRAGKGPQGEQKILAVAMRRKTLTAWLEAFDAVGLPLQVVSVGADALAATGASLTGLPDRVLFLDLDFSTANLLWRVDGHPAAMRGLRFGLRDLALAVAPESAPEDLESARRLLGRSDLQAMASAGGEVGQRVAMVADSLARELLLTVRAVSDNAHHLPEIVVLSGDAASVPGFGRLLEPRLSAPVRRISQLEGFGLRTPGGGLPAPRDELAKLDELAVAHGLALHGAPMVRPDAGLNFYAEGAALRRRAFDPRRYLALASAVLAIVVLGFSLSAITDIVLKRQRLAGLEARLASIYAQALPDVQGSFTRAQYASILNERVRGLRQDGQGGGQGRPSTLRVLASVSQAVGPELDMTIAQLTLDDVAMRISARSDAFATVERIKENIQHTGLGDVQIKAVTASPDGKGVQFQLEVLRAGGRP